MSYIDVTKITPEFKILIDNLRSSHIAYLQTIYLYEFSSYNLLINLVRAVIKNDKRNRTLYLVSFIYQIILDPKKELTTDFYCELDSNCSGIHKLAMYLGSADLARLSNLIGNKISRFTI